MSYFDEDLQPRLAGEPFTYNFSALKSVFAVPIKFENDLVGYFFMVPMRNRALPECS